MLSAFLCHNSEDSRYVIEVAKYLNRNFESTFYYENHQRSDESFVTTINKALNECNVMIIFVGNNFTEWQIKEANSVLGSSGECIDTFIVLIGENDNDFPNIPSEIHIQKQNLQLNFDITKSSASAKYVASKIISKLAEKQLTSPWISDDDLPLNPHLFSSEKEIIGFFKRKKELGNRIFTEPPTTQEEKEEFKGIREKLLQGCPSEWPLVTHWKREEPYLNRLDPREVGKWRSENSMLMAAGLSQYHQTINENEELIEESLLSKGIVFPEAGPRENLYFPQRSNNNNIIAAIAVSGGIAPGINAVISGIVERHRKYANGHNTVLNIYGYKNGFHAFFENDGQPKKLNRDVESEQTHEGGSIIGTFRADNLIDDNTRFDDLKAIDSQLYYDGIDILYIIGGDGSMKAAHALWNIAQNNANRITQKKALSVVAIPKTMDNDILWMWQSFGFMSAVQEAREVIERLHVEVKSNPRLCVVQLFGSDSGFVVSHSVLASATGHCDAVLIPEIEFSMKRLAKHVRKRMCERSENIPGGLVVMAETAIPTDAMNYVDEKDDNYKIGLTENEKKAIKKFVLMRNRGERIQGQTEDELRTAGLKIVSQGLKNLLQNPDRREGGFQPDWRKLRVFTSEPRHLLRATRPSSSDFIMGHRLGTLAVDNAMAGYTDFMISQWLTEFVLVPLKLVVLGRKRIPDDGIFWKSVLAKTDQPAHMV